MLGIRIQQQRRVAAPALVGDAHGVLAVHRVDLAVRGGLREERAAEELGKPVQGSLGAVAVCSAKSKYLLVV